MSSLSQQIVHDIECLPEILQSETLDFIHFLQNKQKRKKHEKKPDGQAMADVLDEASKHDLFSDIKDPSAWQQEIRKDRTLYGREE